LTTSKTGFFKIKALTLVAIGDATARVDFLHIVASI